MSPSRVTRGSVRITAGLLCTAAGVVGLSACGSHHTEHALPAPPASSVVVPKASGAEAAKSAALAAYSGMWNDFLAASATSDWQSPDLARHATGAALQTLTRGLRADRQHGLVGRGIPTHTAAVSTVDPLSEPVKAVVTDCSDTTNALKYRVTDGKPADAKPGGRRRIVAILAKQLDGAWKVTDVGVHEVGTC